MKTYLYLIDDAGLDPYRRPDAYQLQSSEGNDKALQMAQKRFGYGGRLFEEVVFNQTPRVRTPGKIPVMRK